MDPGNKVVPKKTIPGSIVLPFLSDCDTIIRFIQVVLDGSSQWIVWIYANRKADNLYKEFNWLRLSAPDESLQPLT